MFTVQDDYGVEVDPDEEAQNEVFICPEESMDSFNNSKVCSSVADPGSSAFLTPGSGMGKNLDLGSRSSINISGHISERLVTTFWVKNS
jgi:hypothetical protein